MGGPGPAERGLGEPGVEADDVDRCGGQDVAEVGLGQTRVAGAADAGAADGLRDGAFDACAYVVALLPLLGLLFLAALGQNFLLLTGQEGQAASALAVGGRGALGSQWTGCAVGGGEVDAGQRGPAG